MDQTYWNDRYLNGTTGWDLNKASQPIMSYINQLKNKDVSILIPGAGNAYEAEYLWQQNFKNLHVLDIASAPLKNLKKRLRDIPESHLIQKDFFEHQESYDLIIEQTFFCALDPKLRADYVKKMHDLLKPKSKLVGLLFDFPLTEKGPPFGGNKEMYIELFESYFKIISLEPSYNSEPSRMDKELFFIFEKI